MGILQYGWSIMENPQHKWMITGGSPILGNFLIEYVDHRVPHGTISSQSERLGPIICISCGPSVLETQWSGWRKLMSFLKFSNKKGVKPEPGDMNPNSW